MPRFRKPTKDEIRERRAALSERARSGHLQLPGAVVEMRQALGLSQEGFARLLKLTTRQLAEIERGVANPTAETLTRVGRLFGFGLGFVPIGAPGFVPRRSKPAPDAVASVNETEVETGVDESRDFSPANR